MFVLVAPVSPYVPFIYSVYVGVTSFVLPEVAVYKALSLA